MAPSWSVAEPSTRHDSTSVLRRELVCCMLACRESFTAVIFAARGVTETVSVTPPRRDAGAGGRIPSASDNPRLTCSSVESVGPRFRGRTARSSQSAGSSDYTPELYRSVTVSQNVSIIHYRTVI